MDKRLQLIHITIKMVIRKTIFALRYLIKKNNIFLLRIFYLNFNYISDCSINLKAQFQHHTNSIYIKSIQNLLKEDKKRIIYVCYC